MEGLCLEHVVESGIGKVQPSAGTQYRVFEGISWGNRFPNPATFPNIEQLNTGATGRVKLTWATTDATTMLVILGTGYGGTTLAYVAGTSPDNTHYSVDSDNQTLIVHADNINSDVFVVYTYSLTVVQAMLLFGENYPGMGAVAQTGSTGLIVKGIVYTDQFDTSVDWSTVNDESSGNIIVGGQNGVFTLTAAAGADASKYVYVEAAPSVGLPFLGLYVDR